MKYSHFLRKVALSYIDLFPFYRTYIHLKLRPLVPLIKDKKVLEVGCGEGTLCRFISKYAKRVHGLDLNPDALEIAKKLPNVEYVLGDATKLPFPSNSFDFIVCSDVLEHIEDDKKAIREMRRVLKKGGKFFISVPNSEFLENHNPKLGDMLKAVMPKYLDKDVLSKKPFGHKRLGYSKKDFEDIAKKFGFKIVSFDYVFKIYRFFEFRFALPTMLRFVLRPILDPTLVFMYFIDKKKSGPGGAIFVVLEKA